MAARRTILTTAAPKGTDLDIQALRQRAIADAIQKQSMTPFEGRAEPTGNAAIRGLTQLATAVLARNAGRQATGLENQATAGVQNSNQALIKALMPDTPDSPGFTTQGGTEVGSVDGPDAAAQQRRSSITQALASQDPRAVNALLANQVISRALPPAPFTGDLSLGARHFTNGVQDAENPRPVAEVTPSTHEKDYAAAKAQGFQGTILDFIKAQQPLSASTPAPPSYRDVLDPKDQTRLITVDGRFYKPGGSLGDPGVIGVAGKEPTAAKAAEVRGTGKDSVSTLITQLRDYYGQLQQSGGITDITKSGASNFVTGMQESGMGQAAGRMFGTNNQSLRNQISQQRPLLLQAIRQATGMSSKQMDSNVELKLYLSAATDPTLDVQANISALDNLEKLYGIGTQAAPTAVPQSRSFATEAEAEASGVKGEVTIGGRRAVIH